MFTIRKNKLHNKKDKLILRSSKLSSSPQKYYINKSRGKKKEYLMGEQKSSQKQYSNLRDYLQSRDNVFQERDRLIKLYRKSSYKNEVNKRNIVSLNIKKKNSYVGSPV